MVSCASRSGLRRSKGTTLLEVLVTIVIFLVGILAVAQIFPKGFQVLLTTNRNSMATALARDQVERLSSAPDQMPEMILPIRRTPSGYVVDSTFDQLGFSAVGNELDQNGHLWNGGFDLGEWSLNAGPNVVRRVIGEGRPVSAPRQVGQTAPYYGSLMLLRFGPIELTGSANDVVVYGNDLAQFNRAPAPSETISDNTYYVVNDTNSSATLLLPMGTTDRVYHFSVSAYTNPSGTPLKQDFPDLSIPVPAGTGLYSHAILGGGAGQILTLQAIDRNTLRVQRQFEPLALGSAWSSVNPYEFKILSSNGGILLNPLASSVTISRSTGREPLWARANYNVADWQIIREDVRLVQVGGTQQVKLAIGSIRVGSQNGPDGRPNNGIPGIEPVAPTPMPDSQEGHADNVWIVDVATGGTVRERREGDPLISPNPLVAVNKSSGLITFRDLDNDASNGTTGRIVLADGSQINVELENRALRVFYRANNNFSVQVLKAPAHYSVALTNALGAAQYFVGQSDAQYGTGPGVGNARRIYFPRMDISRKVTVGRVNYLDGGGVARQAYGQDFIIRLDPSDPIGPYIDLQDIDSSAMGFNYSGGDPVSEVKGSSVAVRVSWNPDFFSLAADPVENLNRLNVWGRSFRSSTNETFVDMGGVTR